MGCRFPGAANLTAFTDLLLEGRCAIGAMPADRFDASRYYDPDVAAVVDCDLVQYFDSESGWERVLPGRTFPTWNAYRFTVGMYGSERSLRARARDLELDPGRSAGI